jgi:hypothetical protein
MAPQAAQFNPAQVLDAGRRAENDGRVGYAIQFYRHLTDQHAGSPEAAIAKEALTRLAQYRPVEAAPANAAVPPSRTTGSWPSAGGDAAVDGGQQPSAPQGQPYGTQPAWQEPVAWQDPARQVAQPFVPQPRAGWAPSPSLPNGQPPQHQPLPHQAPPMQLPLHQSDTGRAAVPRPAERQLVPGLPAEYGRQPLRLRPAERRYSTGRAVAWLLIGIGLVAFVSGGVLLMLAVVGIRVPGSIGAMLGVTGGVPGAIAIMMLGVFQTFAGQIGRAVFDTANATRDLAMIERARIAHAAGEPTDEDDEPA